MTEQERMTNKERRAKARAERKAEEAAAAKRAKQQGWRRGAYSVIVLAVVGGLVYLAFGLGPDTIAAEITLSAADAEAAREDTGCEIVSQEVLPAQHFDPATAPPADALYTGQRPTNSGPHFSRVHQSVTAGSNSQLDERPLTHNLEHGAVIAWYDPAQVEGSTVEAMEAWSATLDASGFDQPVPTGSGASIFVSPYTDPGITSGKAVAFRGWGISMDCDSWNEDVANAFVIDNFGPHGIAPERLLATYPQGTLAYSDREVGDTPESEAPVDEVPGTAEEGTGPEGTGSQTTQAEDTATEG